MRSKFEQRTEHVLDDKDFFYFRYDHSDDEIDLSFHSSRNDVTEYTMTSNKFLRSLSLSIDDFDNNELEILKKISSALFTQIQKIEAANELHKDAINSSEAA